MRCAAHCTASAFDTQKLFATLKTEYKLSRFREVLYCRYAAPEDPTEGGDVFFFPYGSVVFWGLSQSLERSLLKKIQPFEQQPVETPEEDICTYEYGTLFRIQDDHIMLPNQDLLTKLAISHGLAQSVKLGIFEQAIQKTSHWIQEIPELLSQKGKIQLSRKDIRKRMGRLFITRSSINLHQELLDTPEFFWERPELEPYYAQAAHYIDRERRVNVLNQRLTIIKELLEMLGSDLNYQHATYLEWTVIWLITVEVLLTIGRDILKIF